MSSTAAAALAKRRVRRQKQFIAVGSVCLLAILGYQMPKLLGGHDKTSAPAVTTTTASTATAATGSPPAPTGATLRDTDGIAVERDTSQLLSFGIFKSKDPFVQQLSAAPAPAPHTVPAPTTPVQKKTTKKPPSAAPVPVPTTTVASGPPVVTTPVPVPTSTVPATTPVIPPAGTPGAPAPGTPGAPSTAATVFVTTNGVCEQLALNATFPANEDIFRLVEIAKDGKSIRIAIVGGSYDSGQATATAKLGEKLTLVNTSDGSRYVIVLRAKCTPAPVTTPTTSTISAPTTTTPPAALVPAPAPTPIPSSSEPPIVTDASDTSPLPN